ncbi:MAG: hypothetical protein AAFN74_02430 [Myxococcota bacterium]
MVGFKDIQQRALRVFKRAKSGYLKLGRYQRMKALIVGLLAFDFVATIGFVFALSLSGAPFEVSYREEFPTRLIVIRNQTRPLFETKVVLDDAYQYSVMQLEVGAVGIDLRDFRDAEGLPPDLSYQPTRVRIESGPERFEMGIRIDAP